MPADNFQTQRAKSLLAHYLKFGLDRAAASHYANEQAAKYSIHSLRHMFAWTLHKASGNNIKMVQEKLGHHDVSTTMRYLEHLEEPVDDHSGLIARQLGLSI